MKRLLALAACLFSMAAHAQPACWLVTNAKGYTMGQAASGMYAAWWCPDAWGDWSRVTLAARTGYVLVHPTLPAGAAPADVATAYWRANVAFNCVVPTRSDPALLALCDAAANAANDTRPLPPFVVRSNGTSTTRPTYPLVAGVRGTVSNGSVSVLDAGGRPTPCNSTERSGSYMQVQRKVGTVTLCSATP